MKGERNFSMQKRAVLLGLIAFLVSVGHHDYALASRPLQEFGMGSGQVSAEVSFGEKVKIDQATTKQDGKFAGNVAVAVSPRVAFQFGHHRSDAARDISVIKQNVRTHGTVTGPLEATDYLVVFNAVPKSMLTPGVNIYTGARHVKLDVSGNIMGQNVSRKQSRTGGVLGAQVSYNIPLFANVWLDTHYANKEYGVEIGLSKEIVPKLDLDLSYYMDKYKYNEHHLDDKGFRAGLTFRFKP